jgi:two-component system chemotaxis sensor kinase CheA
VVVVICREGDRQVGIAVEHVLDVAAGSRVFEGGTNQVATGITLLKDRVTGVVDLGSVARVHTEIEELNAVAEAMI